VESGGFMPVIPATQKPKIRRNIFHGKSRQKVYKNPSQPIQAGYGGAHLVPAVQRAGPIYIGPIYI
jgi:hypothetical protein